LFGTLLPMIPKTSFKRFSPFEPTPRFLLAENDRVFADALRLVASMIAKLLDSLLRLPRVVAS